MNVVLNFFEANQDALSVVLQLFSFVLALTGGIVALIKWGQQIRQNRAEKVKELLCKVRDDEDISMVMDCIDWDNGIEYDGKFHFKEGTPLSNDAQVSSKKIDKTLSHFSYICYLKKRGVFNRYDIANYEYELRRIFDNGHIADYLYSIYHWSKRRNACCPFHYLIEYALQKGYIESDFKEEDSEHYSNFLGN